MTAQGDGMTLSFQRAFFRQAGKSAAVMTAFLAAHVAMAETDPQLAEVDATDEGLAGTFAGPDPLADPAQTAAIGRVYLAQPVGSVSVGEGTVAAGKRKYGYRSTVAGSAAVVSFSSVPIGEPLSAMAVGPGQMPLSRARLTSAFGVPRAAADGGTRWHAGVDLAAPTGSPVAAAYAGRVSSANWRGGYGLMVVLDHGNGMQTRYAHLSRLTVRPGQQVRQGELVGLVGSTGHSTGPHLHYEVRRNGQPLNPLRQ